MGNITLILSFSIMVALGIMSPGPSFIYTVTNAINYSKKDMLKGVLGIAFANFVISTLSVTGLRVLFYNMTVNITINIVGGIYLLYISYKLYKNNPHINEHIIKDNNCSFTSGFFLQIFNVKAILFITSSISVSITSSTDMKILILFTIITFLVSYFWYSLVGLTIKIERVNIALRKNIHLVNKTASLFILFLVGNLFYSIFKL